jgi:hypothetical protein
VLDLDRFRGKVDLLQRVVVGGDEGLGAVEIGRCNIGHNGLIQAAAVQQPVAKRADNGVGSPAPPAARDFLRRVTGGFFNCHNFFGWLLGQLRGDAMILWVIVQLYAGQPQIEPQLSGFQTYAGP